MTEEDRNEATSTDPCEEKHRAHLLGLVYLVRQMARQLIEQGEVDDARGFVDTLEALQAKTRGNVDREEEQVFEAVLFELRMAVVTGPPKQPAGAGPDAEATSDPEPKEDPSPDAPDAPGEDPESRGP